MVLVLREVACVARLGLRNQQSQVVDRPDAVPLPLLASGAPPLIEVRTAAMI